MLLHKQNTLRVLDLLDKSYYDTKLDALLYPYLALHLKRHPGLKSFVLINLVSEAACEHAFSALKRIMANAKSNRGAVTQDMEVKYRRLNRARLQVRCAIDGLEFLWEALDDGKDFRLRKFGFLDSEDLEYYWRCWEESLEEAELDYVLEMNDRIRFDNDEDETKILELRRMIHGEPEPKIIKSVPPSKTTYNNGNKKLPKSHVQLQNGRLYNHHDDIIQTDEVYDDYSYIQSHPVFPAAAAPATLLPDAEQDDYDDDDDIFGVCHSLPPPPPLERKTKVEPHLQVIVTGEDDKEYEYWGQYEDESEY